MKWINNYGDEFDTRDEAYQDAEEMLDSEDILRWIVDNYPASTILEWMGDKALDPTLECIDAYFNENYGEVEDDDDMISLPELRRPRSAASQRRVSRHVEIEDNDDDWN